MEIQLNENSTIIMRGWFNDRHFIESVVRVHSLTRDEDIMREQDSLKMKWPSLKRFEVVEYK